MVSVGHYGATLKDSMLCFLLYSEQNLDSASSLAAINRRVQEPSSASILDIELEPCEDAVRTSLYY